jgi:hypothetical protein
VNPRALSTNPRAYDRGAARADGLVAGLATGLVSPDDFAADVLTYVGARLDSESQGFVGTVASRLAELVASRQAGAVKA